MSDKQELPTMDPPRWQQLNEMFAAALELEPAKQKQFLEQNCGDDEALQLEVAAILAATRDAGSQGFLEADAFAEGARVLAANEIPPGTIIGGYRVVREIGRGGMGAVYLAQRQGFQQQVALKIIKRGMDTEQIIRRFVMERDVLASLNHPNIARLLDGGHTADGLPFIAMEYVEGKTITEFCDQKRLSIEERIELFRKVCKAVTYAHHNLVVHRDIKPSNILVTSEGEPKLLDFGIAKLLAPEAGEATIEQTVAGANLMTPDYASPEQIRGERVTTVSDIYSLGVLLYELLCGRRPFDLKNRPSAEVLRIVSEQEPSAPSTAALTEAEVLPENATERIVSPETLAGSRNERPARLQKRLRGDLDNIVLTALRKDPLRRYSSVEQFSEDLERHLAGLPVTARPATFAYQISKFAQRNRVAVSFAALALIALLAGLSISIWQAAVARQERARAEQRFNEVRKLANTLVSGWDKDIPEALVSGQVRGRMADISTEYLDNLARETDDPVLLKELAQAYQQVGYHYQWVNEERSESSLRKGEALARRLISQAPADIEAKRLLAEVLGNYDGYFSERDRATSLKNRLEIVRLNEEILALNPNDLRAMFDLANAYALNGKVLKVVGRVDEGRGFFDRATDIRKRRVAILEKTATTQDDRARLASSYIYLAGDVANETKDFQSAEANLRRGAEVADALLAENPAHRSGVIAAVTAHYELGVVLKKAGDIRGSIEPFRKSLNVARSELSRHPGVAYFVRKEYDCLMEIAETLNELGDSGAALTALRESLHLRRLETERKKTTVTTFAGHGYHFYAGGKLLMRMKQFDEAHVAFREVEEAYLKFQAANPGNIGSRRGLATLYLTLGDYQAGLAGCNLARSQSYGGVGSSNYCPPDSKSAANTRFPLSAKNYYQRAADILSQLKAENRFEGEDQSNLAAAREKLGVAQGS